jgi:hypothetical protein
MDIEEVKKRYLELSVIRFLIKRQIKDINNWFIADLKSRDIVPNAYSCQKCGNELILEEPVKIIENISPKCMGCLGNITITKKMVDNYIKKRGWNEIN